MVLVSKCVHIFGYSCVQNASSSLFYRIGYIGRFLYAVSLKGQVESPRLEQLLKVFILRVSLLHMKSLWHGILFFVATLLFMQKCSFKYGVFGRLRISFCIGLNCILGAWQWILKCIVINELKNLESKNYTWRSFLASYYTFPLQNQIYFARVIGTLL